MIHSLSSAIAAIFLAIGSFFTPQTNLKGFSDPFLSLQLAASPSNGYILQTDGTNNSWVPAAAGGGGGGGTWSTTTSQTAGTLINYPNNVTDVVAIGGTATNTTNTEWWFDPAKKEWMVETSSTTFNGGNFNFIGNATTTTFGITSLANGLLQVDTKGSVSKLATTTVTCAGTASCTTFAIPGSSPITITGSGGSGNVATSTAETQSQLAYWTTTSGTPAKLSSAATTSLTASGVVSLSQPISVIGGSASAITVTGGTNGQVLGWSAGVPTWVATTTLSTISGTLNLASQVTGTLAVANGGTGSTTLTGILLGAGTSAVQTAVNGTNYTLITGTTCSGTDKVSAITAAGAITCSSDVSTGGSGVGTVATSSLETAGQIPYWTTTSGYPAKLTSIATSSLSVSGPFSTSGLGYLIGGSSPTVTYYGLATTTAISQSQLLYGTSASGISSVATSSLGVTSPITFSGTIGAQIGGAAGNFGCATCVTTSRALTVAGTANQITSSAGSQDLSSDRTWTLSLPNHVIFPNDFFSPAASTTNATSTNFAITNLLTFNGVTGSTWAAFCTAITGGAGLCDGTDAGGSATPGGASSTVQINSNGAFFGNSNFVYDGTNVGIASSTPKFPLSLGDTIYGDAAWGSGATLPTNLYGTGDRSIIFWNPATGAFGAFERNTGTLAPADIGGASALFGWNNKATGYASFTTGKGNTASGDNSAAFGLNTTASGDNSAAFGNNNTAGAAQAVAFGKDSQATGTDSFVSGTSNLVGGSYSTALGNSNAIYNATDGFIAGNTNIIRESASDSQILGFDNIIDVGAYDNVVIGAGNLSQGTGGVVLGYSNIYGAGLSEGFIDGALLSLSGDNSVLIGQGISTAKRLAFSGANSVALGSKSTVPSLVLMPGRVGNIGNVGIGTSSPFAEFSIHALDSGTTPATTTLFAIASSTASATTTLFSINNIGTITSASLTAANCDVKASTSGVLSCGTDATGAGGSGNVATSSAETAGNLAYWTSTAGTPATLGKVATTTLTLSGFPAQIPSTYGKLVGGADTTFTWWGLSTTSALTAGQLLMSNGAAGVSSTATTSVTCSGTVSCTGFTILGSSPITISGTGGSGGGTWSTTTSQVAGTLINYPNNATDIVTIGGSATTSAKTYIDPNTITSTPIFAVGTSSPWGTFSIGTHNLLPTTPAFLLASSSLALATTTQFIVQGGNVGVGTSTPGSILSVQGVANFVANGVSTIYNGLIVLVSLIIPNAANPSLSTTGALAVTTTAASSSLQYYDGSATRALYPERYAGLNYASTTLQQYGNFTSGTSTIRLYRPPRATTLTEWGCQVDGGTAVQIEIGTGSASTTANCTTTFKFITPASNNTFTRAQQIYVGVGSQSGTVQNVYFGPSFRPDDE